jgi:hypothetical protein
MMTRDAQLRFVVYLSRWEEKGGQRAQILKWAFMMNE